MKGFEKDCYLADLSDIPWDSAYICDDTDDIHDHWHHIFIKVVDQRFPFKKKYIGDDQLPWITLEIYFAISRGNIFFRKFEGNKSDDNWEQFKKQRNLVAPLKGLILFHSGFCWMCPPRWILEKNSSLFYLPKVLNNNIYNVWRKDGWLLTTWK